METRSVSTTEALGPLNEHERKYAPETLYLAGNASLLRCHSKVSVVGSRKASEDGIEYAHRLTTDLVEAGVVVVSGLANGVDAAAHTAAMQAGGGTIAVIGTPLERTYPRENAALQARLGPTGARSPLCTALHRLFHVSPLAEL